MPIHMASETDDKVMGHMHDNMAYMARVAAVDNGDGMSRAMIVASK